MDLFYAKQRPEFEPGEAGVEAAKLEKFSAGVPEDASSLGWGADGSQIQWLSEGSPKMHHLWGRAPADSHFLGGSSIANYWDRLIVPPPLAWTYLALQFSQGV